jgi:uncharacterized SAM-binding protein YcdF (DUF218 family)
MSDVVRHPTTLHTAPTRGKTPVRARGGPALARVAFGGAVLAALALTGGFLGFARDVSNAVQPVDPRADAIVVLTGGVARIDGALQLLAQGRAERLLISGVNRVVTPSILGQTLAGDKLDDLACCVDLGHVARDTIGNAAEARRWVEDQGFTSLIVVTSDYHMPRSMVELGTAMPAVRLIPFPVTNPDLHLDRWWRDPSVFGFLIREYAKFLYAKVRLSVTPTPPEIVAASR